MLRYGLKASDLAVSEIRRGTHYIGSTLLPPARGRRNGVGEGYVFLMGEHLGCICGGQAP
jgi:hypothetical protein